MAFYAIGDVQGCYDNLCALLEACDYKQDEDTLWFTGDLVNRGPRSLEVLRFIYKLPRAVVVLGNHDLTLLALAFTHAPIKQHNLDEILTAPDCEELLMWLRCQPLLYHQEELNTVLVHAGIPPQWSLTEAKQYANEAQTFLQGPNYKQLLENMYGNQPDRWHPSLSGWERYRFIINGLTRIRFCDQNGRLDFSYKGPLQDAPAHLIPWYKLRPRDSDHQLLFGHWATLEGKTDTPYIEALDTGCCWGRCLTAFRLDDGKRFSVAC